MNVNLKKRNSKEHEALCRRCGICCGSEDGDPCEHLRREKSGEYFCSIYNDRLGMQKTVNGNTFRCVPIEIALKTNPELRKRCAYARRPTSKTSGN